jgi:hypothetical protein
VVTETPYKNRWAILIGVQGYKHARKLKYCQNDAVELSKAFRNDLGFPPENVLEFHEGEGARSPARDSIYHELAELQRNNKVAPDDLLVFYFTGHGARDEGTDYLLPIYATPRKIRKTGISVADISEELKDTGCENIVMFVDACRDVVEGGKGLLSIGEDSKSVVSRAGIVTFFSCDPKDQSFEIEAIKHGSFTHCILKSIRQKRRTTAAQLAEYLREEVQRVNIRYEKPDQVPYAVIEPSSKGTMEILFNPDWRGPDWGWPDEGGSEWDPDPDALGDALAALYGQGQLAPKYYGKAVDIILDAKRGSSDPRRLRAIRDLCTNELTVNSFQFTWDAFDRVPSEPGLRKGLPPLTPAVKDLPPPVPGS